MASVVSILLSLLSFVGAHGHICVCNFMSLYVKVYYTF